MTGPNQETVFCRILSQDNFVWYNRMTFKATEITNTFESINGTKSMIPKPRITLELPDEYFRTQINWSNPNWINPNN